MVYRAQIVICQPADAVPDLVHGIGDPEVMAGEGAQEVVKAVPAL
jgi:hypothetical protein